jgi:hypothetical protein
VAVVKLLPNVMVREMENDAKHDGVHGRLLLKGSRFRNGKKNPRGQDEKENGQENGER